LKDYGYAGIENSSKVRHLLKGKNTGKGPTIKCLTHSIAALTTKIDKFSLPACLMMMMKMNLQRRRKAPPIAQMLLWPAKARRRSVASTERQTFQLSKCLGSVGHVEEGNRSDLDSHADCCVCGQDVLVFNDFDREVTVTGWDPEGEIQSLRSVSAALGYTTPESGKTALLIFHQIILSPTLNHNLLIIMQLRLHDVIGNERPKFQSFNLTNLSHSIGALCPMHLVTVK
jgi:hypothetical protein